MNPDPRSRGAPRLLVEDPEATDPNPARAAPPAPADFEVLIRDYQALVFRYVYQLVQDHHLTEDLSQEVFLKAYRSFDGYDPRYVFSTWLLRVAHSYVIDHLRKSRLTTVSLEQPVGESGLPLGDSLPQAGPEPGEQLAERDMVTRVRKVIDGLPLEVRGVLVLRFIEGRKLEEIGYILDLPVGTVKSRLNRARTTLRERLTEKNWGGAARVGP